MRVQVTSPSIVGLVCCLFLVAEASRGDCPDLSRANASGSNIHIGRFYDSYWGFSVRIPEHLRAYSDPAPAPMHGINVVIADNPRAIVYLLAYDKPVDTPFKTIVDDQLDILRSGGSVARLSTSKRSRVGGLSALRYDVTYSCGGNDPLTETFLLFENPSRRVFYRIGLYTSRSKRESNERVFRRFLSGLKVYPIKSQSGGRDH